MNFYNHVNFKSLAFHEAIQEMLCQTRRTTKEPTYLPPIHESYNIEERKLGKLFTMVEERLNVPHGP